MLSTCLPTWLQKAEHLVEYLMLYSFDFLLSRLHWLPLLNSPLAIVHCLICGRRLLVCMSHLCNLSHTHSPRQCVYLHKQRGACFNIHFSTILMFSWKGLLWGWMTAPIFMGVHPYTPLRGDAIFVYCAVGVYCMYMAPVLLTPHLIHIIQGGHVSTRMDLFVLLVTNKAQELVCLLYTSTSRFIIFK